MGYVVEQVDPTLDPRLDNLENNEYKITYYEVVSGTSGVITLPTGATINEGEFGASGNSILSKINISNKPTYESPKTSGGVIVTANLATNGSWTASGTYTDSTVALIYSIKIKAVDYQNLNYDRIIESEKTDNASHNSLNNLQGGATNEYYHLTASEHVGTGTGNFVRANGPTMVNPNVGTQSANNSSPRAASTAYVDNSYEYLIAKDIQNSSVLTGTTTITLLKSILIPAGTISVNDVIYVKNIADKTTVVSVTENNYLYINTSNTLTGATRLSLQSSTNNYYSTERNLRVKSATSTTIFPTTTNSATDVTTAETIETDLNIDWNVDQYIIHAFKLNNTSNSVYSSGLMASRKRKI